MPELPDVTLYVAHLARRLVGQTLESSRVISPNLLRTAEPSLETAHGRCVVRVRRLGKRIVIELEGPLFLVFHLMIAGRFHWQDAGDPGRGRKGLATFQFTSGTLSITEVSRKQRASLHVLEDEESLGFLDRGGLEPLTATLDEFRSALLSENHTLKRALTDPRLLSGIGNSYSDEILQCARQSPLQLTRSRENESIARLYAATREVLFEWIERLEHEYGDTFPEGVTAFRPGMAVHGKFRQPCPVCGTPVQRIVYSENETNYCPHCQTGGRLLADRALSRLLRDDWPRTLEQMES